VQSQADCDTGQKHSLALRQFRRPGATQNGRTGWGRWTQHQGSNALCLTPLQFVDLSLRRLSHSGSQRDDTLLPYSAVTRTPSLAWGTGWTGPTRPALPVGPPKAINRAVIWSPVSDQRDESSIGENAPCKQRPLGTVISAAAYAQAGHRGMGDGGDDALSYGCTEDGSLGQRRPKCLKDSYSVQSAPCRRHGISR
jgi:hypothetical protein